MKTVDDRTLHRMIMGDEPWPEDGAIIGVDFSGSPDRVAPLAGRRVSFSGILQADGSIDIDKTGGDEIVTETVPRGAWLLVDGVELVEGPDLQKWVQVVEVHTSRDSAEGAQDDDPRRGNHVGPMTGGERLARFWGRLWLLCLDRNGNAVA